MVKLHPVKLYSTNHSSPNTDYKTALFRGLAPDGGLYMPDSFPVFSKEELAALSSKTLPQIGEMVLGKWLPDIPEKELALIVEKGLHFPIPVTTVGNRSVLELFHGPTMAFKDVAAGLLAQTVSYYLQKEKSTMTILVATSGDTGSAIAQAFSGIKNVKVVIVFPKGRVSNLQEEQLTRVSKNVTTLEVNGDFDDCQAFVKEAFIDKDLQELNLSSANSINIGRLLPQIIYFVWAYAKLQKNNLQFIVPSGNMGSITAGLFARKMGLPFSSFVIATNENDTAVKYYKTGIFERQKTVQTLSTAMDIGHPSNFVRILELFKNDHNAFRKIVQAVKITDEQTVKTLKKVHTEKNYLMDFHTAVGFTAANSVQQGDKYQVVISTASPLKFAAEIEEQTGIHIDNTAALQELQKKEKRVIPVTNTYDAVKRVLLKFTK